MYCIKLRVNISGSGIGFGYAEAIFSCDTPIVTISLLIKQCRR